MKRSSLTISLRIFVDMLMVSAAWLLSYHLRFAGFLEAPLGVPPIALYIKLIPFILAIWFLTFLVSGFYRRTGSHRSAFVEGLDILQSCILATLVFIAFTYFYDEYRYSRLTMVLFGVIHPTLIISGRSLLRKALRYYLKKVPARNVLVIASRDCLEYALRVAKENRGEPVEVTGVIVPDLTPEEEKPHPNAMPAPEDFTEFFSHREVNAVVIALVHRDYGFLDNHLEVISNQVIDVSIVPDAFRYSPFATGVEQVGGIPVIRMHESPLMGPGSVIKRFVDIAGALLGLLIFGPVMLITALLVPLSSKGPILYRQRRMGYDGKTFDCLKFRSMPVDAELKSGAVWASPGDNRATKLGQFLRKTSIDELPQFFNVLRGDMSLVGPRPERPVFVKEFRKQIPGYMLRHKVKTGLTGWAQVNGWRGNTSLEKRIECDLFYIQNWSLWFDIKIILLTAGEVFRGRNAY